MKTTNFYCIVEFCSYYLVIRSFTRFYFVSKSHITSVVRLWQFYLLPGSEKKRENVQMEVNTHSAWELMWNILYVQKMHRFSLPRREYELTWRTSGGFSLTVVALLCAPGVIPVLQRIRVHAVRTEGKNRLSFRHVLLSTAASENYDLNVFVCVDWGQRRDEKSINLSIYFWPVLTIKTHIS